MSARYEELIKAEALELLKQEQIKQQKQLQVQSQAQEAHLCRLTNFLPKIGNYAESLEYIDLAAEDRQILDALVKWIEGKPLDNWSQEEKRVIKFFRAVSRSGVPTTQITRTKEGCTRWEYTSLTLRVKGAKAGVLSVLMNKSINDDDLLALQKLGAEGWELVSVIQVSYGVYGAEATDAAIAFLKRLL
jgi:hypothetical protein